MAGEPFDVRSQLIDLRLNLAHSGHLNLQLVIDAVDLHPHNIEQLPTHRWFLACRALRAVFPGRTLRACCSCPSARSAFAGWSTLPDSPLGATRPRRTRRAGNPLEPTLTTCALHRHAS